MNFVFLTRKVLTGTAGKTKPFLKIQQKNYKKMTNNRLS